MKSDSIVHFLWTGGWDSTFRLLQLLEQGKTVQPHYLIDAGRHSTQAEKVTMERIRKAIEARWPDRGSRLLPIRFTPVSEIPEDKEITAAYWRMRERVYVGSQYEWMARYCAHSGIEYFDFGYNSSGPRGSRRLRQYYTRVEGKDYYIVDPKIAPQEELLIFRWYHFSLGETTKVEMQQMAEKAGYLDILNLSWFCHQPRPDMTPCGTCAPCASLMTEDMRWRIPWRAKVRYYTPGKDMLLRFVLHHKGLYQFINRFLRRSDGETGIEARRQDLSASQ